jgi:hypothetical protein
MQAPDIWETRLISLKRHVLNETNSKHGLSSTPWKACECSDCLYITARRNCYRATSYAASLEHLPPEQRKFSKGHPDYVVEEQLRASVAGLGAEDESVVALLKQMKRTPEYFEVV